MWALGSLENMFVLLKRGQSLLNSSLEKVIVPNLSFLQKQCGLSVRQIVQLIKSGSRLIELRPEAMKIMVKRAEELGVSCSSQKFVYALITVASLNESTINSRVHYLKSLGLSQEEVTYMISTAPTLLKMSEELLGCKIEFLKSTGLTQEDVTYMISRLPKFVQISEELLAGCNKIDVVRNSFLLSLSLEKRLIPRNLVWKLLKSKEFLVVNQAFSSFAKSTEQQFMKKFVLPYQHAFPGLLQAYVDVCAGKIAGTEWFTSISS